MGSKNQLKKAFSVLEGTIQHGFGTFNEFPVVQEAHYGLCWCAFGGGSVLYFVHREDMNVMESKRYWNEQMETLNAGEFQKVQEKNLLKQSRNKGYW